MEAGSVLQLRSNGCLLLALHKLLGLQEVLSNIMVDMVNNNITEAVPGGQEDLLEVDDLWHYTEDFKAILGKFEFYTYTALQNVFLLQS